MRILVVDDEALVVGVCRTMLESEGYDVDSATDVSEAMRIVQDSPPDLIIMDIMMPGVDGTRATRMFKQNLRSKHIPIIIISGTTDDSLFDKSRDHGASACFRKPFEINELLAKVRELVGYGTSDPDETPKP